jgi:hypothetical protein
MQEWARDDRRLARRWRPPVFFLVVALTGVPLSASLPGTPLFEGQASSATRPATRTELLFNNVVITLKDGKQLYGLFVAAESDDLVIKAGKETKRIPRIEILQISLEAPSSRGSLMVYGAVLGIYAGDLLSYLLSYRQRDSYGDNIPFAYIHMDSAWAIIFSSALYGASGMGLGYLASLFGSHEAVFNFSGAEDRATREWERLRRYASGASSGEYRFHIAVQGGNVFFGPRNTYEQILRERGQENYYYDENPPSFNLMRQLRVTVSASKWLDLGAAIFLISEPSIRDWSYSYPDVNTSIYRSINETFSSTGYFAVAAARLPKGLPNFLSLTAGVGLGVERIDFRLNTSSETEKLILQGYYYSWQTVSSTQNDSSVHKTAFAAAAFGEVSFFLGSGLSLGLAADYVFGPSQTFPSQPDVSIPARRIRFSNGSAGFSLGYHF